jgi:putative ABC transport system substrate-binding protein
MQAQQRRLRLSRRAFVAGVGGIGVTAAGLALLVGCGPAAVPRFNRTARIAYLGPNRLSTANTQSLVAGLQELGWAEGKNITLEWAIPEPPDHLDQLPGLAAGLVRRSIDVIMVTTTPAALAAKNASTTVPIVMVGGDPVRNGLAASLARPGGNLTGISQSSTGESLIVKRVGILKELFPALSSILYLWNGLNPANLITVSDVQRTAADLGLQVYSLDLRGPEVDLMASYASLAPTGADGLINASDPLFGSTLRDRIVEFAANARLPAIYDARGYVDAGGLMSYGPNFGVLWRSSATYVDRILGGANPAEMPIEQPTKFDFVVSARVAGSLGITIPPDVAAQVTEWVQ